ncbi:50S ribosomal protein L29 [Spiroplasma apis B31]|uniref:Large ribosomal subunit protein uL29 n=1 Tax=Spiroplasma apis B31 TaxID=1276258 RepID=V5RLN3_SPIAP|nr:50S ribosomal protein L29 [Spiroplasma apis]AHB36765.1 50S ribosomal protein L29 [Spiroplasma apis B31]
MSKTVDIVLELRTKIVDELIALREDNRAELFALRYQAAIGSLEQTHKIKDLRKNIARINTILQERKAAGEDTNKVVKIDYNKAVEAAEKAGKEVRKKQKEMIEKLQAEQSGVQSNEVSDEAIATAMEAALNVDEIVEVSDEKPNEESKPKKTATTKAKATEKTKTTTTKSVEETKPKKTTTAKPKVEEVKPIAKGKTTAQVKKPAKPKVEVEAPVLETGEAKATGKGKAALSDVKVKSIKVGSIKGEGIEGIDLKLSKKPKEAKTYVFGSNAQEAKKQIDEANKKAAAKKTIKKADGGAK